MCHCAPVLSIHNKLRKHVGSGSACVQDVHRGYALPENDSGCAPTARLSAESSDIYSRSTPPSNFEIGSSSIPPCSSLTVVLLPAFCLFQSAASALPARRRARPHTSRVAVGTCVSSHAPRPDPYVRLSRIRLLPRVGNGTSRRIRSSAFDTRPWL